MFTTLITVFTETGAKMSKEHHIIYNNPTHIQKHDI